MEATPITPSDHDQVTVDGETPPTGAPVTLRSSRWFSGRDRNRFMFRSWMKAEGLPDDSFDGRPVIGICNTWSELTPCNLNLAELAAAVKRGVWQAGGVPLEFPTMSLGETQMLPTTMLFRNLLSMVVEELIRANPIDGVVLLGGCDKNTPAQLMGAASVDLPTIVLSSGPKLNGKFRGCDIGSGTDLWRFSEAVRGGEMPVEEFLAAERGMSRSAGFCNTMGTASTMACIFEAMGLSLPGNGTIPATDAHRTLLGHLTGRRIVEMVEQNTRLSTILDDRSFANGVRACSALGGSTNAIIHLLALAGRLGIEFSLDDWDRYSNDIPVLVDLMPVGRFLMEDFHYAGGVSALLGQLGDRIDGSAATVSGQSLGAQIDGADVMNPAVIRTIDDPAGSGGVAVLRGNLCPDGAVIKVGAATPELLTHRGRALAFDTIEEYRRAIEDPDLDVTESDVLVVKNCGPCGYPGMPEVGNLEMPRKLVQAGCTDMVRISDARMSGTAYGTVILHVAPEAAIGGPLALVRTGDWITLDVESRSLYLEVDADELARRAAEWQPPDLDDPDRGYVYMYRRHVQQADTGADLDFLRGSTGSAVAREGH